MANVLFPTAGAQKIQNIWNTSHALADEGAYFIATNPTPLTPIAITAAIVDAANAGATSAQTRPVSVIYNPWAVNDPAAKAIYLQYWWFLLTTIPATGNVFDMCMWLDPVGSNTYSSGGSKIVPVAANPGIGSASRAQFYFGAITANPTTAGGQLIMRRKIDSVIPVVLDEYMLTFGDVSMPTNVLSAGTVVKRVNFPLPPVVIPPGFALKLGMFGTGNTGTPAFEFECGYVERQPGL